MVVHMVRWLRLAVVSMACLGMISAPVVAQTPIPASGRVVPGRPAKPMMLDVALDAGGSLRGEVRNEQGQVKPDADVVLWKGMDVLQRVRTDARGRFQFDRLRGGQYRIATADVTIACRAWTAGLAPPAARQSLLVVANMYSARGQQPINEVFCFNPFLMGTIIAAAIAIPIAVHDSGDGQLPDGS